jgi:hypothetical protein
LTADGRVEPVHPAVPNRSTAHTNADLVDRMPAAWRTVAEHPLNRWPAGGETQQCGPKVGQ